MDTNGHGLAVASLLSTGHGLILSTNALLLDLRRSASHMSAPSRKSGFDAWAFILWIFVGYFFLGFPAAFLVGLDWLPSDATVMTFAPLIWAMEQTGPLGEAWGSLIMEIHSFGQSLQPR